MTEILFARLDELVSGDATTLAAAKTYTDTVTIKAVENIVALRALTTLSGIVNVKGYLTAGDGGGGLFIWNGASVAADNTGTIIIPDLGGTGRWLRVVNQTYNVQSFGAGLGAVDDTVAVQKAITALSNTGGGILETPQGTTVNFAGTIIPVFNVTIHGAGIKDEGIATTAVWNYTGTGTRFIDARAARGLKIEGMRIQYSSVSSFTGSLIDASLNAAFITLRNNTFGPSTDRTGTATLLNFSSTVDAVAEKNYFLRGKPAVAGQSALGLSVRVTLKDNTYGKSEGYPIINGGESWTLYGETFQPSSDGIGRAFTNGAGIYNKSMVWIGTWTGDVTVNGTSYIDGEFQGLTIIGGQFQGPAVPNGQGITLRSSTGVNISGVRFESLDNAINAASAATTLRLGSNVYSNIVAQNVANPANISVDDFTILLTGATTLSTIQSAVHTWSATQTFTLAPVFTDAAGSRSALGLGSMAVLSSSAGGDLGGTWPNPTILNAPVIAKVLTGYTSGAGVVAATDTILQAIQKLNGNDATNANLTGDVTSAGNATTLTNAPVIAKVLTAYAASAGTVAAADTILQAFQKLGGLVDNAAWSTYSPSVASSTVGATPATYLVNSARYKQTGKKVIVSVNIGVSNQGVGATGSILVDLPVTASSSALAKWVGTSYEYATTGKSGRAYIATSGTVMELRDATATTYIVTGNGVVATVEYEIP